MFTYKILNYMKKINTCNLLVYNYNAGKQIPQALYKNKNPVKTINLRKKKPADVKLVEASNNEKIDL